MEDYPRTLRELEARFATEQACREYLARLRWGQEFVCPACDGTEAWPTARGLWMCAACGHQASVIAGTIFQGTRTPLSVWFRAIWWVVIAAEVRGRAIGRIRMQRVADASADSLLTFVQHAVQPGSVVITDGLQSYRRLPKRGYRHDRRVLLGRGESAEAVLPRVHRVASLLKRWLLGTHQGGVSREHLDYYLDEFTFRFNRRTSRHRGKLFHRLLEQAVAVGPVPLRGDGQRYPWSEEETPPQPVVGT